VDKKTLAALSNIEDTNTPGWKEMRQQAQLPFFGKPKEFPQFPKDITAISYRGLGNLHSRYTGYMSFINAKLAQLNHDIRRNKMDFINARARKLFMAKGLFKAEQFSQVNIDPEVVNLRKKLLQLQAKAAMFRAFMWTVRGYIRCIEFEKDRRQKGSYYEVEK
jgi:hypothetical protein